MNIDFNQVLKNFEGEDLEEIDYSDPATKETANMAELLNQKIDLTKVKMKKMTLKGVCINAINRFDQNEKVSSEETIKRYELCLKISKAKAGIVNLKSESITLIKTQIGKTGYTPLIKGQAWEMLEGKVAEKEIVEMEVTPAQANN